MGSFFIAINMVGCRLKIARGRLVWVYYNRKEYYARSSRHFRVHFVVRVCCDSVVNSVEWAVLMAMGKKGNHSQWQLQRHFLPSDSRSFETVNRNQETSSLRWTDCSRAKWPIMPQGLSWSTLHYFPSTHLYSWGVKRGKPRTQHNDPARYWIRISQHGIKCSLPRSLELRYCALFDFW